MDFLGRAETLVRVVETGSLSKAARARRLSLAAVSRQIASLEAEVGATLLARTTRRLTLTEAGRRFHEHAVRMVHESEAARASVRTERAVRGRLVVVASVTFGTLRIVPELPALLAKHPALDVELRLEDRETDVIGEGVDLAIRANMVLPDSTRLVAQPLATYERVLVGAPSYLRRAGTPRTVAALARHAVVLGTRVASSWTFGTETVAVMPRLRIDTMLGIRSAVVGGLGLAILPDFTVHAELAAGTVRRLLPNAPLSKISTHALYRVEAKGLPRIEAVVAHLRATL